MGVRTPTGQRLIVGCRNIADAPYPPPLGTLDEPGRSFSANLSADF